MCLLAHRSKFGPKSDTAVLNFQAAGHRGGGCISVHALHSVVWGQRWMPTDQPV